MIGASAKIFAGISEGLGISLDDLHDQLNNTKNSEFQPIIIKPDASPRVAFIESHRSDIPVLEMISVSRRYLPADFLLMRGYVGEVSEQQIEASNGSSARRLRGKDRFGAPIHDLLQGTDGMRRVVVNSIAKKSNACRRKRQFRANRFC